MCESLVPTKRQEQLKPELKALFSQKDRQAADQAVAAFVEKYQSVYPTAIKCHEPRSGGLPDLLCVSERRNTGRPFAPILSSSGFSGKSSVAPTRWRRLFATKGVVYCCFMRSLAVCTSTKSPCPLHQLSNQTPRFYTQLDILPELPYQVYLIPQRTVKKLPQSALQGEVHLLRCLPSTPVDPAEVCAKK